MGVAYRSCRCRVEPARPRGEAHGFDVPDRAGATRFGALHNLRGHLPSIHPRIETRKMGWRSPLVASGHALGVIVGEADAYRTGGAVIDEGEATIGCYGVFADGEAHNFASHFDG